MDLHDCCAQDMADIVKRLELCKKLFKTEPARGFKELKMLRHNTRGILDRTRQVIFKLRSHEYEKFDLYSKLISYIKDYEKANNMVVKLAVPHSVDGVSSAKGRSIFYLITEALINIKRHSQARNVKLSLECDDRHNLRIYIKDDGKGFDIDAARLSSSRYGKWGIVGMRQRAASLGGTFAINSQLQKGTTISFKIPL